MAMFSNIVACCLLGCLGLLIFDYFSQAAKPARRDAPSKRFTASSLGAALCLICALWTIWVTVVVVIGEGKIKGVGESRVKEILADRGDGRVFGAHELRYKNNSTAVMAIVFEWIAWACLFTRSVNHCNTP